MYINETLFNWTIFKIEKMLRDVRKEVIQYYMTLFASYEREGLEIDNVWHIFTLQYMFMPRIQEQLNKFKFTLNNHPLESEHDCTLLQLILIRNNETDYSDPLDLEHFGVEGEVINIMKKMYKLYMNH